MTILQELAALYDKRADDEGWPRPGFSTEKIGAVVVLDADGVVREINRLGAFNDKGKFEPRKLTVPSPPGDRRGLKLVSGCFWDPMPYALGVGGKSNEPSLHDGRADQKFAAFRAAHLELLEGVEDPALIALRRFCEAWEPATFFDMPDVAGLVDQNVVFRVGDGPFLHDLAAAQTMLADDTEGDARCLVSGKIGAAARLHPSIKGVMGAQTAGAALVSFNDSAHESHGQKQGDNAPVSQAAAFAYGTALNALLARGSGNTLRIGGDTVAFWAEEAGAEEAIAALFGGRDDTAEAELRDRLWAVADGRARQDGALDPAARLYILGLAPNAARLAVRYWHRGTMGDFARRVTRFWRECAIEPSPFRRDGQFLGPKPWVLLYDLAAQRDARNIPDGLGGDLMRAILTGGHYPATLLAATIRRLRVEGAPEPKDRAMDGRRAAMIRAVLVRNFKREVPMALDESAADAAYLLGRLFAAYTYAEKSYQERGAGLRQKYMGAASATPARVFPVLMRGYEHNLSSLRKAGGQKAGAGVKADRAVAAILDRLPGDGNLPASLPLEKQGRFFIGFYHQISAFYARAEDAAEALIDTTDEGDAE